MGHDRHAALLQKQFEIVIDQFGCEPEGGADIGCRAGMPRNELPQSFRRCSPAQIRCALSENIL